MGIRQLSSASAVTGAKSNKFWNQSTYVGDFVQIASAVVTSGGTSAITFSGIPQTYTHLQVRYMVKTDAASPGSPGDLILVFGGPNAGNGYTHILYGVGSGTPTATSSGAVSYGKYASYTSRTTELSNAFGVGIVNIFDYTNANKSKTWRTLGGWDSNGSGTVSFASGLHNNTSALTSISFSMDIGYYFAQYSSFALYGVR